MQKLKRLLFYWLPPFLWMVAIFYFSSRESAVVSEKYILNFLFFKTLHLIEYALLYFFLFRAFLATTKYTLTQKMILAAIFSILYAISDELHQTFVPTREGTIRDVFIDALGVVMIYIYIKANFSRIRRFL